MYGYEGDWYFADLASYEDRREYEEWLDSPHDPADDDADWPDEMVGEEEFA